MLKITSRWLDNDKVFPYILLAPCILFLFIVTIYPTVKLVNYSLVSYRLTSPDNVSFVGFQNFINLFLSPDFWNALKVTMIFSFSVVLIELFLGLVISLLVARTKALKQFFTTIFTLPMAIAPVCVAMTFRVIYNPEFGILNYFLELIGSNKINWVYGKETALMSLILIDVWQWTPFMFIIIFAGLLSLPIEPYEASIVDGASPVQVFRFITWPLLKNVLLITSLIRSIDSLKAFDIIHMLTKGGPGTSTTNLNYLTYLQAFNNVNLSYASTIALILLMVAMVGSTIFVKKTNLFGEEEKAIK